MRTSKSTEAQIALVLKQAEDGTPVAEVLREGGNFGRDILQLAQEVRRPDALGDAAAAPARG